MPLPNIITRLLNLETKTSDLSCVSQDSKATARSNIGAAASSHTDASGNNGVATTSLYGHVLLSGTAPTAITTGASNVGTLDGTAARADHVHSVATASSGTYGVVQLAQASDMQGTPSITKAVTPSLLSSELSSLNGTLSASITSTATNTLNSAKSYADTQDAILSAALSTESGTRSTAVSTLSTTVSNLTSYCDTYRAGEVVFFPEVLSSSECASRKLLPAMGQTVSRTTYSSLFSVFGTKYGAGDGSTTFVIPDLTGRVLWGSNGTSSDTGYKAQSLPDFSGHVGWVGTASNGWPDGSGDRGNWTGGYICNSTDYTWRASNFNAVLFQEGASVRPPSLSGMFYIRYSDTV